MRMIALIPDKNFLRTFAKLSGTQLWILSLLISVVLSEFVVIVMESLLRGEITYDYLLTGLITSFLVASMVTAGLIYFLSNQKLTEEALRDSEARFRNILEYTPIGMAVVSLEGKFMQVNHALCEIVGYPKNELEKLTFQEITYPDDLAADLAHVEQLLSDQIPFYQMEKRYIRKNGQIIWIQLTASILRDSDNKPLHFIAQIEDISERKSVQDQIQQLAYYDVLTNLPNRRLLIDRMNHSLVQAKRYQRSMAVMFLDLDHFKGINDTMGHDAGDELLKLVAARLNTCVRSIDIISRQGGDEFVIVLTEITHSQDAALVAQKVVNSLRKPIVLNGKELTITTSVGIAVYPSDESDDAQELMKKADIAMYSAKTTGRNNYRFFKPEML